MKLIMSDFSFHCPHCGAYLEYSKELVGSRMACSECEGRIELPDEGSPPALVRLTMPRRTRSRSVLSPTASEIRKHYLGNRLRGIAFLGILGLGGYLALSSLDIRFVSREEAMQRLEGRQSASTQEPIVPVGSVEQLPAPDFTFFGIDPREHAAPTAEDPF